MTTSASATAGGLPTSTDEDTENSDALGTFDRAITSGAGAFVPIPPRYISTASGSGVASQSVQFAPTSISGFVRRRRTSVQHARVWQRAGQFDLVYDVPRGPFDLDGQLRPRDFTDAVGYTGGTNNTSLSLRRQPDAGGAEETLYSVTSNLLPGEAWFEQPADLTGVLEPGYVYSLVATAAASGSLRYAPLPVQLDGEFITDVTFSITMVPEPSAAAVAALAAGLLLRRRRR